MDPATALGVAAAVVQFVEIGLKALALCKEIRDSDTDTIALHAELQQSTKQLGLIQSGVTLDAFPQDTSRSIKQCSQECSATAVELQDLLSEIRAIAQKKRFGAARAAFRAMKDQKKIEKIQNKLEKSQLRFQTAVSVDTREKVLTLLQTHGRMSQTLEDVVYPELKRMHDSTHNQISTVQKRSTVAHETTHKALASLSKTSRASGKAISDNGTKVQGRLDRLQISHIHDAFLQSLEHPHMFARHRQIDQPATGTFEWIFMRGSNRIDQDSKAMVQGRFSKWLRSSQPVFWINGKAGSGKSSLMSFIESHERTQELLKIWAGGRRLHVLSFFFWRAGSEIQRSISGVLQSLLYQLAYAKPEIIGSLNSSETSLPARTWTQARLQRAIEKALSYFSEDRIFVLIDGLDEFEGNYTALTTLILGLQNGSHSKFCLSSRPEAALTRQLGSYPSLRLQDLNYDDIELFVHGELKPCEDVFRDPREFRMTVRDVSHHAEGIFLWAALVSKSLVSGYESRDDADMLRQRLRAMPSGLEALFARMFSNIDREHRECLSKCFFLLKWSKENHQPVISDISVPVMTAFLHTSPHHSLNDFVADCRVVEHRVIAQAKGLLETYQPKISMFDSDDDDLQEFGLDILSNPLSSGVGQRSFSHATNITETYTTTCIGWVHRSAYDYVFGDHSEHVRSWQNAVDEESFLRRLLDAQSWLAHYFPGQHMDPVRAPVSRIINVFEGRTGEIKLAGLQALDKLLDKIEASYYGGGGCHDQDQSFAIGSKFYRIYEEAWALRAFWMNVVNRSQDEYFISRFDKIRFSACADLICSGTIQHYWFWDIYHPSNWPRLPAMTLSFDHLLNQGPRDDVIVAAHQADATIGHQDPICLSWRGKGGPKERRIVSDVSGALKQLKNGHHRAGYDSGRRPPNYVLGVPELFAQRLIELADFWKIYCGRRLEAFRTVLSTPLQLHVSARVYGLRNYKQPNPPGAITSEHALPGWRFLCFGYGEARRVRLWESGEQVPVMACFDVKAPKIKQLMDQFGHVRYGLVETHITLRGTSKEEALCLETILEEVWADSDAQFDDGWQQLYMLACLRKYFSALWNVPRGYQLDTDDDEESESDEYEP